ncbi:MAG: thymidine phosphorylase, partial [Pseudomonadota bacterium]
MLVQEIIARKRDRLRLSPEQICEVVDGIARGTLPDAQAAALAMAIVLNGMDRDETVALTLAMRDSGRILDWDLDGPVVDKHSTGGVGDKVSLVLAPVLAACGALVPMISGRGLGHTGGTLDKLEAIPGYRVRPSLDEFRRLVGEVGCAIVGASDDLAPADRRLYAIRDVTATVESVPLITASILSKKLAAGLGCLVMDVKVGSGAFLPSLGAARELATSLVEVAEGAGLPCRALLTDMNQCLGATAGNALEVGEAIAMLRGESVDWRLEEVVVALAATALVLAGLDEDEDAAAERAQAAIASGAAAERFARMVEGLGGPSDLVDRPGRLPMAPVARALEARGEGYVAGIDVRALGWAVVELGGGRRRPEDDVDPAVGLTNVLGIGDRVEAGQPLAVVHGRNEADVAVALSRLAKAFVLAEEAPPAPDLFKSLEPEAPTIAKPGEAASRPVPRR